MQKGKTLPELNIGSKVLIQDHISKRWNTPAKVIGHAERGEEESERTYLVETETGTRYKRNRRFLRPWEGGAN